MVHPNGREGKGLHGRWAADMVVGRLGRIGIGEWVWMRLRDSGLGILAPVLRTQASPYGNEASNSNDSCHLLGAWCVSSIRLDVLHALFWLVLQTVL